MYILRVFLSLFILSISLVCSARVTMEQQNDIQILQKKLEGGNAEQNVSLFNRLSEELLSMDSQQSFQYADSAYRLALVLQDSIEISRALYNLGEASSNMHQYENAIEYYHQAYRIELKTGSDSLLSEIALSMGVSYMHHEVFDEALHYYREAASIQEQKNYQSRLARTLFLIGSNFYSMSDYLGALDYLNQALDKNNSEDDVLVADIYNSMGIVYFDLGSFEQALKYYLLSLEIVEEVNNKSGTANVLNNIGIVYYEGGNLEKALEYYQKSLRIEEGLGNIKGVADSFNNIGIIFSDWDQNELALSYYEKALKIYNEYGDQTGIADAKNNIGESYAALGRYDEALDILAESLEIELNNRNELGQAQSYHAIALVYFELGQVRNAINNNSRSFSIADSFGFDHLKMINNKLFYKIYEKQGDYNTSLFYYKEYKSLEDSIYNRKLQQKISGLQLKYEIDQKEKERLRIQEEFIEKQENVKKQRMYLLLIFIVMLVFGMMIYFDFRSKSKTSKTLKSMNAQIKGHQKKLDETLDRLSESEAKYKTLVENSPTGILLLNTEGKILEVNQKMLQILGSPGADETKKINCLEYPPLVKIGLVDSIQKSIKTKESINNTFEYISKWGKHVHLICIITPLINKSGQVYSVILNVKDTTESSQAEKSKKESETKYRMLVENSLQAMLIVQDVRIIFANSKIEELTHYSVEEVKNSGRRWLNLLIHPDDKRRSYKNVRDALSGQPIDAKQNYKIIRKDGEIRIIETLSSVVEYQNKAAMLIVAVDITERTIARDELVKSEQRLKEVNAMKDKFFSIIAHDLKNPFNSIMGFSNLLNEAYENYSEKQRKAFIQDICESSENTFKLLQNLLEWSRTQTGNIDYNPQLLKLKPLILEILAFLKSAFTRKKISFQTTIPDEATVYADVNMINFIIRNLLSNALKFTYSGGNVNIAVVMEQEYTVIEITDNGVGIKKENLSRIFRIDKEIKTQGTAGEIGSGLGLILCKEFVEKNSGQIRVESTHGKGSTFRVFIPARDNFQQNEVISL